MDPDYAHLFSSEGFRCTEREDVVGEKPGILEYLGDDLAHHSPLLCGYIRALGLVVLQSTVDATL